MTKDDGTWLNICYVIFAIIMAYVAHKAVYTVGLQTGLDEKFDEIFPLVNTLVAVLVGAGSAFWARYLPERRDYHLAAIGEIRKVTWPSQSDTKRMTVVVVIVVSIFSVILTSFDFLWSKALQMILP